MGSVTLESLVSLAKRRGFVYQGSEIYGGLAGTWDYGPLGTALKRNITNLWWQMFVSEREDMYGLDSAILMNAKVWEASGHASGFNDPLVECRNCHSRFREDELKGSKCPVCGKTKTFGKPRQFNMMLKTQIGAMQDRAAVSYLRPETAQGMFVNFKNILDSFSPDLPFGLAQIGKAFRNEISPRDWLFRTREFEQMEIEYFVKPDDWKKHFAVWQADIHDYLDKLGLKKQVSEHEIPAADRAHYSHRTIDFEFEYPFGKSELLGLAYRTDYDLGAHQKHSAKNLEYIPKDGSKPFVPHVIEPSFGIDRLFMAVLCVAYSEDKQNGEKRVFLKLPTEIAPVKAAIFPLLKNKPELVKKAREVYKMLKPQFGAVMFDDNGNIGKRYRRQDEIGTPYCITIDFDTLDDDTVTLRHRDTTHQKRIKIAELENEIKL